MKGVLCTFAAGKIEEGYVVEDRLPRTQATLTTPNTPTARTMPSASSRWGCTKDARRREPRIAKCRGSR